MVQAFEIVESTRTPYSQLTRPIQSRLMRRLGKELGDRGLIPAHARLLYEKFDPTLIRSACIECWGKPATNDSTPRRPTLAFAPTSCSSFLSAQHPANIATVLSTAALQTFYFSEIVQVSKYKTPEARLRAFCVVVCGIKDIMDWITESTHKLLDWQADELFDEALKLVLDPTL